MPTKEQNFSNTSQPITPKSRWNLMPYFLYFILIFCLIYAISYLYGADNLGTQMILFGFFVLIFISYYILRKYFIKREWKVTPYLLYFFFVLTIAINFLLNKIGLIAGEGGFISIDLGFIFANIFWIQFLFTSIIYYIVKKRINKEKITNSAYLYVFLGSIFLGSVMAAILIFLLYMVLG